MGFLRDRRRPPACRVQSLVMAREGVVSVDGIDYRLYRESSFGDFVLEHAGSVIARATKPSAFRREFVISTRNNLTRCEHSRSVEPTSSSTAQPK